MSEISIIESKDRLVAGWASVEAVDRQGDFVPVEELQKAFIALMDRGAHIIYGHLNHPIGKILQWEIKEHPETKAPGVYMIVKVNSGYEADDIVWKLIKDKKLKGFSIGGKGKSERGQVETKGVKKTVNILRNIQLNEVSIVPEPANQFAQIDQFSTVAKCDKCALLSGEEWSVEHLVSVVTKAKEEEKVEETEKSEGAVATGGEGVSNPTFNPTKKPKEDEEDKKEEEVKPKITLSPEMKKEIEEIVKDHLKIKVQDDMKTTGADKKQEERKDDEDKKAKEVIRDIKETTKPVGETKSLTEITNKLALKLKGIADSIDLDKQLSEVSSKIK